MASVYGLLAGAISLVVFGVVVATGFDWSRFSYHPVAMTAGMVVCAPLALEAMRTQRVQTRVEDRRTYSKLHMVLNLLCLAFSAAGLFAICSNKNLLGKPHFTSYHSYAGLAAMASYLGAAAYGLYLACGRGSKVRWLWFNPLHKNGGALAFLLGAFAALLGMQSAWATRVLGDTLSIALSAAIASIVALNYSSIIPSFSQST